MFERFVEEAVRSILAARDEACRLGHGAVGTEHLLVGLFQNEAKVEAMFKASGKSLDDLKGALVQVHGNSPGGPSSDPPFSPDAQKAISVSWSIAEEFRHSTIVPLHLFLAILRMDRDQAHDVLAAIDLNPGVLGAATREALAPSKKLVRRGPYQEEELEVMTPYGAVTLALIRNPEKTLDEARIISLSAEGLNGPKEIGSFLAAFDRLLDESSNGMTVAFFRDLFLGLGSRLETYLQAGATPAGSAS